jgi:glycyl-tRNA synthetase beta chain
VAELLLELLSEEVPARMQARAAEDLARLVKKALEGAGLGFEGAQAFVTPRRLALVVEGLPERQPDTREERRGPRADAPAKAIEGFLGSVGLERDQVEVRESDKGSFLFAVIERPGRATADVLEEVLPVAIAALPWAKSMRWGAAKGRWVRPLHGILCLFDGAVVPFAWNHLSAGDSTSGHRFHAPEPFAVKDYADYHAKLLAARVMLDPVDRRDRILHDAIALAEGAGLELADDAGLLVEVAGLVEWPVVLMGAIDAEYMSVPPEVLITAMRRHQKYFSLRDQAGDLAPRFIMVANLQAEDGGAAIAAGNERVLRARLADARFFWDQDRKRTLLSRVADLDGVIFHAKLGTLGDKAKRIEALAGELAAHIPDADPDLAKRAALLCKADLTTEMVGEFPELQGLMGRYYAKEDGEDGAIAQAIAEHYAPLGPADRCPTAPLSVAVALADKIDTLVGFFAIDEKPTGSKDPFALRRAALGVIRLILENGPRLPLDDVFRASAKLYDGGGDAAEPDPRELLDFLADRLKVHLREKGVRHDLVTAVFALAHEDDLVRLMARVASLADFIDSDDGANLLTAYKRANNIVNIEEKKDKKSYQGDDVEAEKFEQEQETELLAQLDAVRDQVQDALAAEDFSAACRAFAKLREPVDRFFDDVTVNVEEPRLRENRLRLLDKVRARFHQIADFSRIEG